MGWKDLLRRSVPADPAWAQWATAHGWRHDAEAPDLVDRFFPPPPAKGQSEQYLEAVRGEHKGLPFISFVRKTQGTKGGGEHRPQFSTCLAIELPRPLRAELLDMAPKEAFRWLGGPDVGPFDFGTFHGPDPGPLGAGWYGRARPDWLVGCGPGSVLPSQVEGTLEQVAARVTVAPPGVWQD
jgi:hypothetical protein